MKRILIIIVIVLAVSVISLSVVCFINQTKNEDSIELSIKEEYIDKIINIEKDEFDSIVSSFQLYGYMNSVPRDYYKVETLINSNSTICLFKNENKYVSIFTDDIRYLFIVSESIDETFIPRGIVYSEKIYKINEICEIEGSESYYINMRYARCIVSPTLLDDNYNMNSSFYMLTYDGLAKYNINNSGEIEIVIIGNKYIESIINFIET